MNRHHAQYYFEDGVVFQVENTLFKVPRRKLCLYSHFFNDLFTLPTNSSASPPKGSSDDCPIVLREICALDFERLLTYLYPLKNNYLSTSNNASVNWTFDYLRSIMRLTKKFLMDDIRQEMIQIIDRDEPLCDQVAKIQLGIECNHTPWVQQGYFGLITRQSSLTTDEAVRLGYMDAFYCMAARETYWPRKYDSCNHPHKEDAMRALAEWFGGDKRVFDPDADNAVATRSDSVIAQAGGRSKAVVGFNLCSNI